MCWVDNNSAMQRETVDYLLQRLSLSPFCSILSWDVLCYLISKHYGYSFTDFVLT